MKQVNLSEIAYQAVFKYKAQKELATGKRQSVSHCASIILERIAPKVLAGETITEKDMIL